MTIVRVISTRMGRSGFTYDFVDIDAGALITNGQYLFANSNGVTFGTNGSTVTASVQTNYLTNIKLSAGASSNFLSALTFSNGSGVSFGLNGSVITASVATNYLTTAMLSNAATISNIKVSAGLNSNNLSALTFDNAGGVSFGLAGSVITASAPAAAASPINISAGTTNNSLTKISFADSNGIQFGISASTITASHNGITSQSVPNLSFYALGNTTQNSSSVLAGSKVSYNAIGSLTIGYSNGSIQFSAPNALTSQSNQNASLYVLGNTTQNSSTVINNSALSFNALGSITMGYSNGSIQVSAPNALTSQTNQNISLYGLGNTTQNSSTVLNASNLSFNAAGSVTVGYSNGSIQISAANALTSQTNQNLSLYGVGNTTQNSSSLLNASALSFRANGSITVGYSNGSVQLSVSQTNQDISLYGLGNTTQNSSTVINASKLSLNAIGSLTVGYSNGSIQLSAPNALTSQSNQDISLFGLGNTTQNSSTVINASKMSFNAIGSLTVGYSNGSIQLSAPNALTSQTNQSVGLYAISNTTQSTFATVDARSLSFVGAGVASVGASNGSVVISVPSGGGGLSAVQISAGGTNTNVSNFIFSDSNGFKFGINGSTITASQSNQDLSLYALGNTTQNSSSVLNASKLSFNAIGSLTIGYSNGSIQFSAPNAITSQTNQNISLYGLGNTTQNSSTQLNVSNLSFNAIGSLTVGYSNGSIQFSAPNALTTAALSNHSHGNPTLNLTNLSGTTASASNGLTLSLSAPAASIQFFEANLESLALVTHIGSAQTVPIFSPFILPGYLTFNNLLIQMSRSVSNGSNAFTIQAGLYTYVNSTSVALLGSTQNVYSASNTASVNNARYFQIGPFGTNVSALTPGAYVLALNFSAANTLSMNYQLFGDGTASAPIGVISSGSDQNNTSNTTWGIFNFWGRYASGSTNLPANVGQSNILAGFTGASVPIYPYFVLRP